MSLFQWGDFTLHSGDKSWWRIDCDALSDSEINLFAKMICEKVGKFHQVIYPHSHPGSSVHRLVAAIGNITKPASGSEKPWTILVVDDVLTTGKSMVAVRDKEAARRATSAMSDAKFMGAVLFARGPCPEWITSCLQVSA